MPANQAVEHPNPLLRAELGRCVHPGCTRKVVATMRTADAFPPPQVACEAGHLWPSRGRRTAPAGVRAATRHSAH